jgi:hypothetical protein
MNEEIATQEIKAKTKDSPFKVYLRESLGFLFWAYILIKIFVLDIDLFIVNKYVPYLHWIIDYKFFILISGISICWLIIGKKEFAKVISVIVSYPLILVFWRIPVIFYKRKSWIGVFALIGITTSIFKNIKVNFLLFTIVSLSILLILVSSSPILLYLSIIILLAYLVFHFFRKFKFSFKPSNTFSVQSDTIINFWRKHQDKFGLFNELKDVEYKNMDSTARQKWSTNLQTIIIYNQVCYFLSSKLRNYQKSRFNIAIYLLSIIITFFITVFSFGFINLAVYKIEPQSFNTMLVDRFLFFVNYSFNTLLTYSINDFYPISDLARIINSLELFFGFLIIVILFFLFTTILRDKHNEEIDTAIMALKKQGEEFESYITKEFKMDIESAIKTVEELKGGMIKIIYFFSRYI